MYFIEISIDEFLSRTMLAASDCDYAGLIVVMARQADTPDLLGLVVDDWESLHSVTGELIAVAFPAPNSRPGEDGTYVGSYGPRAQPEALAVRGLKVSRRPTYDRGRWASSFWGPNPARPFATVAPRRPLDSMSLGVAGTESVGAIQTLYSMPEQIVPSLVVFSLWERIMIVIPVSAEFRPYIFLKRLQEKVGQELNQIKELREETARLAKKSAPRVVAKNRERERNARRILEKLVQDWNLRVEGIRSCLDKIGINTDEFRNEFDAVRNASVNRPLALGAIDTLRHQVLSSAEHTRRQRCIDKLSRMKSAISQGLPRMTEQMDAVAGAESVLRESEERSVELIAKQELLHHVKTSLSLSQAVEAAIAPNDARSVKSDLLTPPPVWTVKILNSVKDDSTFPTSRSWT